MESVADPEGVGYFCDGYGMSGWMPWAREAQRMGRGPSVMTAHETPLPSR